MLREIPIVAADALFAPPFWARLDLEDETVGVAGTQPLEICSEVSHGNVSAAALAFGARLQISPEKALPNENHLAIEVQMFFLQSKRFGDAKRTEEARTPHYTQIVSQYREESAGLVDVELALFEHQCAAPGVNKADGIWFFIQAPFCCTIENPT